MNTDLHKNPLWLTWVLSSHVKHYLIDFAEQHDLTLSQLHALLLLEPDTPIPMNQLSCLVSCDPSYTTGIVDKLVSRELIVRQESPHDRRVKTITLTPQGVLSRQALIKDFQKYFESLELADHISPSFTQQLEILTEAMLGISKQGYNDRD